MTAALLLALGCASGEPEQFLAFVRGADGYTVAPRTLPGLDDAARMTGELGTVRYGGRFPDGATYTGGRGVDVRYGVEDDVAVPVDEDGLLLWTFWGHLQDARAALAARGVDVDAIFPLPIAWEPAVSWTFEVSPVDNAAYVIGGNAFVLLPDGDDREVPVIANAGVVTHELGHALFHLRTAGSPEAAPIVTETDTEAARWQASLHEGFADSLAVLLLDDPGFLDVTFDMPARDVRGDAVLTADLLPSAVTTDVLTLYDPYPLGTVFASAAWDVREALGDPDETLAWLLRAVDDWAPVDADDFDGARFVDALGEAASAGAEHDAVCDALARRMDGIYEAAACR